MAAPHPETLWGYLGNRRGVWGRGPSIASLPLPPLAVHSTRPGQKHCAQTSPAKRTSWPGVAAAGITMIWHWILGISLVPVSDRVLTLLLRHSVFRLTSSIYGNSKSAPETIFSVSIRPAFHNSVVSRINNCSPLVEPTKIGHSTPHLHCNHRCITRRAS